MKKITLVALTLLLCIVNNTKAQILSNSTARYYLPSSSSFTQGQIDSFNSINLYMSDIINGQALSYPDLNPLQLTWDGEKWNSPQVTAITTPFSTPLMVGQITGTITSVQGALAPNVNLDWADVPGVTQYRFRFRPLGGTWNPSTITGSQRTMTTLAYSTTYEVQVRVYINATTQGEYSQSYVFTTPNFVPLPSCLPPTITEISTVDTISLSWQGVPQSIAYQVQTRPIGNLYWGGTTVTGTSYKFPSYGKSYEYQVRTSCSGTSTSWSPFTLKDTARSSVCLFPMSYSASGKTFSWSGHEYSTLHHIQIRKVGASNWGGTSTSQNSIKFNSLTPGTYEWKVRSRCHSTSNTGWTPFSAVQYQTILSSMSFERFEEELAYPNPASDVINFKGDFKIRDLSGRVLIEASDVADVSHLSVGTYFITNLKGTQKIKIIR